MHIFFPQNPLLTRSLPRIRDAEMKAQQVEGQLQTSKTKRQQLEAKSDNETIQQSEKTPQSTPKLGTEWATAQLQDL